MAGVRRRSVLGGVLGAAVGVSGCGSVARTVAGVGEFVRVAVSWSAIELAAFRAVLAGRGVDDDEVVPFGDDIDAALGARTTGRPNLIALPRLGLVAGNLDKLEPLPDEVWHSEYDDLWQGDLRTERHYALPFKLAHKSVVWYRRKVFEEHGLRAPRTWDEWLELNEAITDTPGIGAPLSLGGADGWMLTGFFENILLRNYPGSYDELARPRHDARLWDSAGVRAAFGMLAEMWGRPGALAGGVRGSLVRQFPDAVLEVFRYHRAAMVVAPDFAESVIRHFEVPDDEVGTFTFPAATDPPGPLVLAGDLFVVTRPAGQSARDLIRYLGSPAAPVPWIRGTGGFIAANPDTDRDQYSRTLGPLAEELRTHEHRFDLADQLGAVGGRDGLQRVLWDLLESLGAGTPRADAVAAATSAMVAIDRKAG